MPVATQFKARAWKIAQQLHRFDFEKFLPFIARLPLPVGYAVARVRGAINGYTGRDWRSMALGTRHIWRNCKVAIGLLPIPSGGRQKAAWRRQRFVAEARDEYEARLIAAKRIERLFCTYSPSDAQIVCRERQQGLVLLTPHFDSFFLGAAFLARTGGTVNLMSSAITHDARVDVAVQAHFEAKYRGMEHYLNGGKIVNMELGMRPYYKMLARKETLIVLGDAPPLPNSPEMQVEFLGRIRTLSAGAVRLAQATNSALGGYVCTYDGRGRYRLTVSEIGSASDPQTVERIYAFFTETILGSPGLWWGADLLLAMPVVEHAVTAN